jgi:WD40 repeat protein
MWWQTEEDLSLTQRLSNFICEVLLGQFPDRNLVIFIDEIDSIRSLDFSVDDFFALIRNCYDRRSVNPEYRRLSFAIAGVATPCDLIQDTRRTPFNIGVAIELQGFQLSEAIALLQGLALESGDPRAVLQAIFRWTNGQPFLTQKLLQIIANTKTIPPGTEAFWVENVVRSRILYDWESQDNPEHLRTIRNRLLANPQYTGSMLALYQQLLQGQEIPADDTRVQTELLLSGLVRQDSGFLLVKNQIYAQVFNLAWVERQLSLLRPYSQAYTAWLATDRLDESRLLRGQALIDAQQWAQGKSLSDDDYQFLAASQNLKWREEQLVLKAERASAIAAQLSQQQKYNRQQNFLIAVLITALLSLLGLSASIYFNSRSILLNDIKIRTASSQLLFASNYHLDALIEAIKAKRHLQSFGSNEPEISSQVDRALQQAVLGADETNRLVGHQGAVKGVAFSHNGQFIATASGDKTVKLWSRQGKLLQTLVGHTSLVWEVAFSYDGKTIVSCSMDGTVKLWNPNGKLLKTLDAHQGGLLGISVSKNFIVSSGIDGTIKLWTWDGKLLQTLTGHLSPVWDVAISNDEQLIVSGSEDRTLKLWNRNGKMLRSLMAHSSPVRRVAINSQGTVIVSGGADSKVKLWSRDGDLLTTLLGHKNQISGVAFTPDGQMLATTANDQFIKLWEFDGTLVATMKGRSDWINNIAISPDSSLIASAEQDKTVKLWRWKKFLLSSFRAQNTADVFGAAFSPDGMTIASAREDGNIDLWNSQGQLLKQFKNPGTLARAVAFSPEDKLIASAHSDATVKLWNLDGILLRTFKDHHAEVLEVAFSPDSLLVASGSMDGTVNLWNVRDGRLLRTLKGHQARVKGIAFNPDGKTIASASEDSTVKLWGVSNGMLIDTLKGHKSSVWDVAFSPNGKTIASAGEDNTVKLWNASNGSLIRSLKGHSDTVWSVAFSPNSQLVTSGSADRTVKVWRTKDGGEVTTLYYHSDEVKSVAFSPNGQKIVSASSDNSIIVWHLPEILRLDLLGFACHWARDYLETNIEVEQSDRDRLCP